LAHHAGDDHEDDHAPDPEDRGRALEVRHLSLLARP
jgi:hypothetical protein